LLPLSFLDTLLTKVRFKQQAKCVLRGRSDGAVSRQQASEQQPLFVAKGNSGQVLVYPDRIVLQHKGVSALLSGGNTGTKQIAMSTISGVQFKGAGLSVGFIHFTFPGAADLRGGAINAQRDENSITFNHWQQKDFEHVRALVDQYQQQLRAQTQQTPAAATQQQASSAADELAKWAQLRDSGVITPEEFEAKKRQLLGL
jgi:hypothetical protein